MIATLGKGMSQRERNPIAKALQILSYMTETDKPSATLGEIAEGVGLSPSTMHRVLGMLVEEELIQQDSNRGRYSLGWKFLKLAQNAAGRRTSRERVRPYLMKLHNLTGETAWFAIYRMRNHHMIFIESVESTYAMRHVREVDVPVPIFSSGAAGRLTLALLPKDEQDLLLASPESGQASPSFTDPEQLEMIKKQGYVVSMSTRGGVGIAVPVFDTLGHFLGIVGLGLPQVRFDDSEETKLVNLAKETAQEIANELS